MTPQAKTLLKQQTITDGEPGTVLRDFQTLLDFVGPNGLQTSGKHHLLPMVSLAELDERMAAPLKPQMKRPQQPHYPHIHGLYLLLRASGLGIERGQGKTGRLELEASLYDQWRALNPTERYFNLLEAWLLRGAPAMLGEREGWGRAVWTALAIWKNLPARGRTIDDAESLGKLGLYGVKQYYHLALLELFGLVAVERDAPREGENWPVASVQHVPFGDALLEFLTQDGLPSLLHDGLVVEENPPGEDEPAIRRFGQWQPALRAYFPAWRNNLVFAPPEFREGRHEFTASLSSSCWRRIAISAYDTLDDLAWAIIDAFDFDGEHLYEFSFRDRDGTTTQVACGACGEGELQTDEMQVGYLPLTEGQSMRFWYDFGADWKFNVRLEGVGPPESESRPPKVVAKKGKAPEEYPSWE